LRVSAVKDSQKRSKAFNSGRSNAGGLALTVRHIAASFEGTISTDLGVPS